MTEHDNGLKRQLRNAIMGSLLVETRITVEEVDRAVDAVLAIVSPYHASLPRMRLLPRYIEMPCRRCRRDVIAELQGPLDRDIGCATVTYRCMACNLSAAVTQDLAIKHAKDISTLEARQWANKRQA